MSETTVSVAPLNAPGAGRRSVAPSSGDRGASAPVDGGARDLAAEHGLPFVDLTRMTFGPGAADLLPEPVARRYGVVPMGRRLGTPVLAVSNPSDQFAMDMLRATLGRDFLAVVASSEQIARALDQLYGSPGSGTGSAPVSEKEVLGKKGGAAPAAAGVGPQAARSADAQGQGDQAHVDERSSAQAQPGQDIPAVPAGWSTAGSADRSARPGLPDGPSGPETLEDELPEIIRSGPSLARSLVASGRVSAEAMVAALRAYPQTGESLARYLFDNKVAKEEDLVWAMAQEMGLQFVDLNHANIDRAALALVPLATATRHTVLPIGFDNGMPVIAMANPTDVVAMDDLRSIIGRSFKPVVATRSQLLTFTRILYRPDAEVAEVAEDAADVAESQSGGVEIADLQAVVENAPIVRYVNLLIMQALNERASDIHIEPAADRLRIRFRIDGVMHETTSASSAITAAVVSRLKVLGDMDIAEHRIPQEGRVSLSMSDRKIDLRLATLPSTFGETVVMRILDKSASLRTLPELGFMPDTLDRYAKSYKQPYGVIMVTGPTGAGKTTTLYATLAEVLTPEKCVVTVEDPVEYQIDGVTQVQINPKAGLYFSNALRSILRADPDIVLIGEIRDRETATIAMEAALSGHLVLTTLHTNNASSTPLRLTEMGIEPFLVTSAVGSVLTQRLARVLCSACKEPYEASEKDFYAAGYSDADIEGLETNVLYRAVGCRTCGHTGYFGRVALAEVMNVSEEIERMIIEQASVVDIERKACEQGMRTLRQDGLLRVVQGTTTLEEVLRVVV